MIRKKNGMHKLLMVGADQNGRDDDTKNPLMPSLASGDEESAISRLINNFFTIAVFLGGIFFVGSIVLAIANFAILRSAKKKQDKRTRYNKIIVRDTLEYKLLDYTKVPAARERSVKLYPFIYMQNMMMYIVVGAYLLPYLIASIVLLLFYFKQVDAATRADLYIRFNPAIGAIMGVYLAVAIANIYIMTFLFKDKAIIGVLGGFADQVYDLKANIYSNLYIDNAYLSRLSGGNPSAIFNTINTEMNRNRIAAQKMIFTYNIYKHYLNNFTLSSPYNEEFNRSFTFEGFKRINKKQFEPVEFLVYDEDIAALTFEDHFINDINSMLNVSNDPMYTNLRNSYMAIQRGASMQQDMATMLNKINAITKNFTRNNVENIYKAIYKVVLVLFAFMISVIGAIILAATVVLNRTEQGRMMLQQLYNIMAQIYETIRSIVARIIGFIKMIFNAIRGKA